MKPYDPSHSSQQNADRQGQNRPQRAGGIRIGGDLSFSDIHKTRTKVIMDITAIESPGFKAFVMGYVSAINGIPNRYIFIPGFCADKLTSAKSDVELLFSKEITKRFDNCSDYFSLLQRYNSLGPFLVIVNDKEKAGTILRQAKESKVFVRLVSLRDDGTLTGVELRKPDTKNGARSAQASASRTPALPEDEVFKISQDFARFRYAPLKCGEKGLRSVVMTGKGNRYELTGVFSRNENSVVYKTNDRGVFVKIFARDRVSTLEKNKIELMLSKKISFKGLCWPTDIVTDDAGIFIGYTMNSCGGIPLTQCILQPNSVESYFPGWNKLNVVLLADTVMDIINYMHTHGILFGSIEPASILVENAQTVYFVDTDRFQIEGFPNFKYSNTFCAPERLDTNDKPHLVTLAEERFAVAELAFALLMPGKLCYSSGSGGDVLRNIREKRFAFSWKTNHGVADERRKIGQWRFVWSHLSPQLKEYFYKTFMNGSFYIEPGKRYSANAWKKLIENFGKELASPELYDETSLMLYPPSFKRSPKSDEEYIRCECCGVEHPKFFFRQDYLEKGYRYCRICLQKPSDAGFTCKVCGKHFFYDHETRIMHEIKKSNGEWKDQKYCKYCKTHKRACSMCGNMVPLSKIRDGERCVDCYDRWRNADYIGYPKRCKICSKWFTLSNGQAESYLKNRLNLPLKCEECRKKRY